MWALRVKTFEVQDRESVLVLEHVFLGRTRKEALHYSESHSKADAFYRMSGGHTTAIALGSRDSTMRAIGRGSYQGIKTIAEANWERL